MYSAYVLLNTQINATFNLSLLLKLLLGLTLSKWDMSTGMYYIDNLNDPVYMLILVTRRAQGPVMRQKSPRLVRKGIVVITGDSDTPRSLCAIEYVDAGTQAFSDADFGVFKKTKNGNRKGRSTC